MFIPPLHPILVHFTAALVPASLISDLAGRFLRRESLYHAAWWMLLYAAVITPLASIAGWLWFDAMNRPGDLAMRTHLYLGTALAIALLPLMLWRLRLHRRQAVPTGIYLFVTGVLVAAVAVQGHLGGMLTFGGS